MQIGDITFCKNKEDSRKAGLLATAVSAQVDIFKLEQPSGEDDENDGVGIYK